MVDPVVRRAGNTPRGWRRKAVGGAGGNAPPRRRGSAFEEPARAVARPGYRLFGPRPQASENRVVMRIYSGWRLARWVYI